MAAVGEQQSAANMEIGRRQNASVLAVGGARGGFDRVGRRGVEPAHCDCSGRWWETPSVQAQIQRQRQFTLKSSCK
jgi:hypothetical protein